MDEMTGHEKAYSNGNSAREIECPAARRYAVKALRKLRTALRLGIVPGSAGCAFRALLERPAMQSLSNVGISKQLIRSVRRPPHGSGFPKCRRIVREWLDPRLRRALKAIRGCLNPKTIKILTLVDQF